jgi:tellurium resistance protein TerZ
MHFMPLNLSKGESLSLAKAAPNLSNVIMGLGWDVAKKKTGFLGGLLGGAPASIDLDASCMLFDAQKNVVDVVWFRQLQSKDGSIQHTGDNRTGAGDGDDEQIRVDLGRVPLSVTTLVFTVNSFTGQSFEQVENAYCRLLNAQTNAEIARYNLSSQGQHTAQVMAKLSRSGSDWVMKAIGDTSRGATFQQLMPTIIPHV